MTPAGPQPDAPRGPTLGRRLVRTLALAVIAAALVYADRAIYLAVRAPSVESEDWYQVLRQVGYLPTWLVIAGLIWLIDAAAVRTAARKPPAHHRAGLVALAPLFAGLAAELLKLLTRRLRPEAADGFYAFRPFAVEPLSSSGVGLPSSHAAVAFGGAVMLGCLIPAIRWPMAILAAGCGVTRLLAGAHFATDVYVGALLGTAIAVMLYRASGGASRR